MTDEVVVTMDIVLDSAHSARGDDMLMPKVASQRRELA